MLKVVVMQQVEEAIGVVLEKWMEKQRKQQQEQRLRRQVLVGPIKPFACFEPENRNVELFLLHETRIGHTYQLHGGQIFINLFPFFFIIRCIHVVIVILKRRHFCNLFELFLLKKFFALKRIQHTNSQDIPPRHEHKSGSKRHSKETENKKRTLERERSKGQGCCHV
jgi:hypothetical protein